MIFSILPMTALAEDLPPGVWPDTTVHWAQDSIASWSLRGVLQGSGGLFRPDDPITRAELAAVIDRVMKYQDKSDVADFSDVDASAWYAPSVLKLNAAGVMLGSGGKLRPNDNITREEAAVMMGRAFAVPENSGNENPFPDAGEISGWASFLVDGMKAAGYIGGYPDGSFGPKNTITRAEVVTILDNMVDSFYHEAGEYDNAGISFSPKNVVINADGVTLKNTAITGDLYITQGVGSGTVTLENVTVAGTTYIWGGGPDSVIATDCDFNVIHLNAATNPALKLSTGTKAKQIYLDNAGTVTHGGVTIAYDAVTDTVTFGGTIDKVTLNADGTATISIGGIIYDVIPPEGTVSKFELAKDAVVKDMVVNAPVGVTGTGKIEKMEVHSDGVVIDKAVSVKPENITVDKDVKIDVGGKEYTGTGGSLPSQSTSGGGSSGGTTTTYTVTYNANGGTGGMAVRDLAPGNYILLGYAAAEVTLPADKSFYGWNTQSDGSGISYKPGDTFAITANTTLYAVYTGDGLSAANPMEIRTVEDLQAISSGLDKHYTLTDDITITTWTPIGDVTNRFTGSFDGGGKTVTFDTITMTEIYAGLFGYIDATGEVRDLTVDGTLTSSVSDILSAYIGGIAGYNYGEIENCTVTATVTATGANTSAGGLAGQNYGTITNSGVTGAVTAEGSAGGLVGSNGGSISNCYTTGNIESTGGLAGGLVGINGGSISNGYATGNVAATGSGNVYAGGLAGINTSGGSIANCAALNNSVAAIGGTNYAGRVAGSSNSGLSNNYANEGMLVNGYTVNSTDAGGLYGAHVALSTVAAESWWTSTLGWDFTTIWKITNGSLPKLYWEP